MKDAATAEAESGATAGETPPQRALCSSGGRWNNGRLAHQKWMRFAPNFWRYRRNGVATSVVKYSSTLPLQTFLSSTPFNASINESPSNARPAKHRFVLPSIFLFFLSSFFLFSIATPCIRCFTRAELFFFFFFFFFFFNANKERSIFDLLPANNPIKSRHRRSQRHRQLIAKRLDFRLAIRVPLRPRSLVGFRSHFPPFSSPSADWLASIHPRWGPITYLFIHLLPRRLDLVLATSSFTSFFFVCLPSQLFNGDRYGVRLAIAASPRASLQTRYKTR